jgi:uncharacterized membrane protein
MKMLNQIRINAPIAKIYALASDTANWPTILPHYRFVRVQQQSADRLVVRMGARKDWIPVSWTAEQVNNSTVPSIYFRHIRGWTKGMEVLWRFERGPIAEPDVTIVTIEHDLHFRPLLSASWIAKRIIGDFFIHNIANATLARLKILVEAPI